MIGGDGPLLIHPDERCDHCVDTPLNLIHQPVSDVPCLVVQVSRSSGLGVQDEIVNWYSATLEQRPQAQNLMHLVSEHGHDRFVARQDAAPGP